MKLIEKHLKLYGDFEVIDYVDEDVIQKLRNDINVDMHTVIPNLRNLGLVTERTESKWRKLGMMYDRSAAPNA